MRKVLLVLQIALLISFQAFSQNGDEYTFVEKGQTVPEFSFETLDGEKYNINDLKGKVVLINFWATWCPPCQKEMPHLESEIWKVFKDKDFMMVAIAREQTKEVLVEYNKKKQFSFPLAPDVDRSIFSKFAKQNIPRNFVIDKSGKIIYLSIGFNEDEFAEMISLIKENL